MGNKKDGTFLPTHGSYRNLKVYKMAVIVYDVTFYFANKYLRVGDRTVDQMVQAARSGKQNIAEGNQAGKTSSETEIKLTNVAKSSFEELLLDYEDYLRARKLEQWTVENERLKKMREYLMTEEFMADYSRLVERLNEEEICNLSITLINQTVYMLRRLIESLEKRFLAEGGIKEQMYRARVEERKK